MSCSKHDVKGYFLGELPADERQSVESHLQVCGDCQEECERLQLTHAALLSTPDEEVPRRIAFVSDKVFEPSWWQCLWQSGPRLGFAGAAMLSLAICVHAFVRPAPVVPGPGIDLAAIEQIVDQRVASRLDAAVQQAVATADQRHEEQSARLLKATETRFEQRRREDLLQLEEIAEVLSKQANVMHVASARLGGQQ